MPDVVLFGAGASKGAGPVVPDNPPLGGELFSELSDEFPESWGNLSEELESEFENDFERGMLELSSQNPTEISRLYRDMAIFFAEFSISDSNNLYVRFISETSHRLEAGQLCLSTLNYECLLSVALCMNDYGVWYGDDPPSGYIRILKLHGSCNFLPDSDEIQFDQAAGSYSDEVEFDFDLEYVDRREAVKFCRSNTELYPALALYRPDKFTHVGSGTIEQFQQKWREKVLSADTIGVVGVNPYPVDTHIWDVLAETPAQIVFIGNRSEFQNWADENRQSEDDIFISNRFDSGFDELTELLS